jgi:hypothetical protein
VQVNDDCTANNDAESAAAFFGGMCAPGAPEAAPANKAVADKLCSACEQVGPTPRSRRIRIRTGAMGS